MMTRRDDFALDESVLTMTRLDLWRRVDRGIHLVFDQELGHSPYLVWSRLPTDKAPLL